MSSMRESPIRRQQPARPTWLIIVVIAVAVLVVVGVLFGVVSLFRGSSSTTEAAPSQSALPCVTSTVAAADLLPKPAKVRVNVYNATATQGLAGKTAKTLRTAGFKVRDVDNDPLGKKIPGVAQLRFGDKGEAGANLLLVYVPGAVLVNDGRTGRNVDLAMGEQFVGLATEAQVAAELAVPTPTSSGAGCPVVDTPTGSVVPASPTATP